MEVMDCGGGEGDGMRVERKNTIEATQTVKRGRTI